MVAGRLDIARTSAGSSGTFTYGRSYREHPAALPIDPVALPLKEGAANIHTLQGYPGVVLDACPDRWGMTVIDRLIGQQEFPAGYLLLNDSGRSGNLAFSRDARSPPVELGSREYPLAELLATAQAVEHNQPVAAELLQALHPGTGGARPKCAIRDAGALWIAKFSSITDEPLIRIPRLEHATLRLAEACGIRAAASRIASIGDKDVCLVRRFDRVARNDGGFDRKACLSARSVFYADPGFARIGTGSYGRLARWLSRYGCADTDKEELYRRMVFNVAVRNSDDHELNHALVRQGQRFRLSEAYDLLPKLDRHRVHRHALLIGDSAAGTVANLLSNSEAFGLDRQQAKVVVDTVQRQIQDNWRRVFGEEAGLDKAEIDYIAPWLAPIPEDE